MESLLQRKLLNYKKKTLKEMEADGYKYDASISWFENRLFYTGHLEKVGKEKEAGELRRKLNKGLALKKKMYKKMWQEDELRRRWMKQRGEKLFQKYMASL